MPGVTSSIRNMFASGAPEKLQTAQQKADKVIQKLRDSNRDPDVTDILVALYEELKERQERLVKYQESSLIEGTGEDEAQGDMAEEGEASGLLHYEVVAQEDGTMKCTLVSGPNDPTGMKSLEFTMDLENLMTAAGQLIATARGKLEASMETLQEFQRMYLSDMSDRLTADEQKIASLKTRVSTSAIEVAAHLYFSDALRFLQTVLSMAHNAQVQRDVDEGVEKS
ncbi:hypothetical protein FPV67DRAFT_1490876 [Lyophyllum atratum]|nr:hypothetical protein FPV67DRAFT_1490876 [Lyophyllum atratum]